MWCTFYLQFSQKIWKLCGARPLLWSTSVVTPGVQQKSENVFPKDLEAMLSYGQLQYSHQVSNKSENVYKRIVR